MTAFQQFKCSLLSIGLRFIPTKMLHEAVYQLTLGMYVRADSTEVDLRNELREMLDSHRDSQSKKTKDVFDNFVQNEKRSPFHSSRQERRSSVAPGKSENFRLDYCIGGVMVSPEQQAQTLLDELKQRLTVNPESVVAFTYSANLAQAQHIEQCYQDGSWKINIHGSNQARIVMALIELLKKPENVAYRGRIIPAAIPTIKYRALYGMEHTKPEELDPSFEHIKRLLDNGVTLLLLQNQDTAQNASFPYAIGGGVAKKAGGQSNETYIKTKIEELKRY